MVTLSFNPQVLVAMVDVVDPLEMLKVEEPTVKLIVVLAAVPTVGVKVIALVVCFKTNS